MAAWDPLDQQAFQIANDPTLPPEQRKAMIDELYAAPVAAPAASPVPSTLPGAGLGTADPNLMAFAHSMQKPAAPAAPPQSHPSPAAPTATDRFNQLDQLAASAQPAPEAAPPAGPPGAIKFAPSPQAGQGAAPIDVPMPVAGRTVKVGTDTFKPSARNIQTTVGPKLSEETESNLATADQKLGEAQIAAAEAGGDAATAIAMKQETANAYRIGKADEQRKREEERFRKLKEYEDRYDSLRAEMETINAQEIDPNRWWNNKSTGDRVVAGLAVALGTLGSAITKQPNVAWEMIRGQIDDDMQAQKENLQAKRQLFGMKVQHEGTIYEMARDRFEDERVADLAALQSAYEQADRELARFEQSAKTPERKAQIEVLRAQIQQSIVEKAAKRELAQQDAVTLSEAQTFDPIRYVQAAGQDPLKLLEYQLKYVRGARELEKLQNQNPAAVDTSHKLYVPGLGYGRTHQDATQMRDLQANFTEVMASFDAAEKVLGDKSRLLGAGGVGGKTYQGADALEHTIKMGIAKSYGGVVTATDIDNAGKETPSLTGTNVLGGQEERLRVAREKFIRRYEAHAKSKITDRPPEAVDPEPRPAAGGAP